MRRAALSRPGIWAVGALLAVSAPGISAQPARDSDTRAPAVDASGIWVTLGTRAGPVASPTRSQPANLLRFQGRLFLVDVGDGSAGQLAKVGVTTAALDGVFISHLHFDHTGGLAAILGLRFQTNPAKPLVVYGPPGTRKLVDGLISSMLPGATAGYGVEGAPFKDPKGEVQVVELRDGARVAVGGITVSVRSNSHYSFAPKSERPSRFQSLSYRFDLPGRSIVYTGDTGPSAAVEHLARGVELLVAEMMDVDGTVAAMRREPNLSEERARNMESHLRKHHLTAKDVGELAGRAGVKALVVTHFVGVEPSDPRHFDYLRTIAQNFRGPAVIANDLDAF